MTNVSPAADPMPEVSDAASGVTNPDWRPKSITDVYTHKGVIKIMAWFEEMRVYELKGVAKKGSGLRRPDDLILDDEYVQPEARGRAWYLLDHVRSAGAKPIVPLEEAVPLAPVIRADRVRTLGEGYHDRRCLTSSATATGTCRAAIASRSSRRIIRAHCASTKPWGSSLSTIRPTTWAGCSRWLMPTVRCV